MKVQKAHFPQPIPNLGDTLPVPAQAHQYKHAKGRATEVHIILRTRGTLPTHLKWLMDKRNEAHEHILHNLRVI